MRVSEPSPFSSVPTAVFVSREVPLEPARGGVRVGVGPLQREVVRVLGEVLERAVLDVAVLAGEQLHDARVVAVAVEPGAGVLAL